MRFLSPHSAGTGAPGGREGPGAGAGAEPGAGAGGRSRGPFPGSVPGPHSSRRCPARGIPPHLCRESRPVLPPRGRRRALQRGPRARGRPPGRGRSLTHSHRDCYFYSFILALFLLFIRTRTLSFIHSEHPTRFSGSQVLSRSGASPNSQPDHKLRSSHALELIIILP